jgi:ubiquinone/menaquinone biosynthesis C-methylase UbiE
MKEEEIRKHYQKEYVVNKYEKKRILSYGGKIVDSNEKEIILSLLKGPETKRVLDLGAGTGRISLLMAKEGYDVTSFDQSDVMLKTIEEKSKEENLSLTLIKGDAFNLPFQDNTFDACVSLRVLWHLPHPEKVISEVQRVLKKDGTFVFDLLNKKSLRYPYTPLANLFVYTKLMNITEMKGLIASQNLGIEAQRQHFIFPYLLYRHSPKFIAEPLNKLENKLQTTKMKKYSSVIYFKAKK